MSSEPKETFEKQNLAHLPDDEAFYMFNALWLAPEGGRARYKEYLKATAPLLERVGGSAENISVPLPALYGHFDADLVFFVRYPNKQAFMALITSPDYKAIAHLREQAITKSLLIPCLPLKSG